MAPSNNVAASKALTYWNLKAVAVGEEQLVAVTSWSVLNRSSTKTFVTAQFLFARKTSWENLRCSDITLPRYCEQKQL